MTKWHHRIFLAIAARVGDLESKSFGVLAMFRSFLTLTAAISAMTLVPSPAFAANWVAIVRTDTMFVEIDSTSINRTGETVRFWSRITYTSEANGWAKDVTLEEANCKTGQSRNVQITVYFVDGSNRTTGSPGPWRYVTPGTVGKESFDFVCGY